MAAECDFVDKYACIDLHAYFLLPESGNWNRFDRVLIKYKRKISACRKKIKCKEARKCEKESKMSEQQKYSNVTMDYLCRFYEILSDMIKGMTEAELTCSISHNFIVQMIPHHQGAIRMSENALRFEICSELIPILDAIIISQREGVREMERLLSTMCSTACGE